MSVVDHPSPPYTAESHPRPINSKMSRPAGYRYGSWLILHGSGAHLVGFSTACWLSKDGNDTLGLWTRCLQSQCAVLTVADGLNPGWLRGTRCLVSIGVVLMLMWLVVSFQCHWLRSRQHRCHCLLRLEELLALASGCCSMLAVGLFVVSTANDKTFKEYSLSWSMWLVVGGACAITVGGVIVATSRSYAFNGVPKPSSRRGTVGPLTIGGGVRNSLTRSSLIEHDFVTGRNSGSGLVGLSNNEAQVPRRHGQHRRSSDITDIFHISGPTFGACPAMLNANPSPRACSSVTNTHGAVLSWATLPPPPPYFYTCQSGVNFPDAPPTGDNSTRRASDTGSNSTSDVGNNCSWRPSDVAGSGEGLRWTFSPPPPYDSVFNDPPPPYLPPPYSQIASGMQARAGLL